MDVNDKFPIKASSQHNPSLTPGREWQRIASGQTIEQYRELGRDAAIQVRNASRLHFYGWIAAIQVLSYMGAEHELGGTRYCKEAKGIGVGVANARRASPLFDHLDHLVAWGELEAQADAARTGLSEGTYPDLTAMCRRFPAPPSADAEAAHERQLRESAERREAQMRLDRAAAEKARDQALKVADTLGAENTALRGQMAAMMKDQQDGGRHSDSERSPHNNDMAAGPDTGDTPPNSPAFTPEADLSPVIAGLGGGRDGGSSIPPSGTPVSPCATDPDRPLGRDTMGLDQIADIEKRNHLRGFLGRKGDGQTLALAREIRALYYLCCIEHSLAVPTNLKQARSAWAAREGKTTRQINLELNPPASPPHEPGEDPP